MENRLCTEKQGEGGIKKQAVKKLSAAEIDIAAREAGMSYGHYVALHNL